MPWALGSVTSCDALLPPSPLKNWLRICLQSPMPWASALNEWYTMPLSVDAHAFQGLACSEAQVRHAIAFLRGTWLKWSVNKTFSVTYKQNQNLTDRKFFLLLLITFITCTSENKFLQKMTECFSNVAGKFLSCKCLYQPISGLKQKVIFRFHIKETNRPD
jgi:hypothetical protein